MLFLGIIYFAFDEMALSGLIGYVVTFLYFLLILKYMKYNKTGNIFTICIYVIYYIFVLSATLQNGLKIYTINISNCLWFIPLVLSIVVYVIIYLIKKNCS